MLDLDPAAEVFDPLLQWDPVPGASAYEVEVNPTAEFTPGSKAFGGIANGTSIAPTVHLLEQHLPLAGAGGRSRRQPRRVERGTGLQEGVRRRHADGARHPVRDHRGVDLGTAPTTR